MIVASFRAEWFRIVRRRAVWFTIGLLLVLEVGIGYGVTYLAAHHSAGQPTNVVADLRTSLLPASLVPKALANAATLDGVFGLVLGVLVQGSDDGWDTVKTVHSQLPGRLSVLTGRLMALALVLGLMAGSLFLLDGLASVLNARLDRTTSELPAATTVIGGLCAEWLILGLMAMIGFALTTALRNSAVAIGVGVGYVLFFEVLVFGLNGSMGPTVGRVHGWFPIANAGYLVESFGQVTGLVGVTLSTNDPPAPGRAAAAIALWLVGLAVVSGAFVRRRDVR